MKKRMLTCSALFACAALFAAPDAMNQDVSCGIDSELFLNPYIESELKDVSGQVVLDAGCGLAPRSILAAQNGATVCAFEPQKQILEQAQVLVKNAGMEGKVTFYSGDLEKFPLSSETVDRALCVNSAIYLPATTQIVSNNEHWETGFATEFSELARVMKRGARLIIASPSSYAVTFTDGTIPNDAVQQHISEVLNKIGNSTDENIITQNLSELKEVMRATFIRKNDKLQLVTDEKELTVGQMIWCKIPNGVTASIYHSEEEYLVAIARAGLKCEEIKRPCFFGNVKYDMWLRSKHVCGQSLGTAYIDHNPFTLFYVVK